MIKKMNCKYQGRNQPLNGPKKLIISKSQPTTKRANKFIIQNIKIATTPVVPIPLGLQDVIKIATTSDSCSPDYKISRMHYFNKTKSNKRAKRFKMSRSQPPNGKNLTEIK